ncbi:MAG: prepilin-type N-terminal cleavage/methylation domain-containing protein [Candidatus Saccharimonadales bacterium]
MGYTSKKQGNDQLGFSMIEILISLVLISALLLAMNLIVINSIGLNARANDRSEASSLAFKKVQDYINLDYDDIPIGDVLTTYEVEDFSTESEALGLLNAEAYIYVEPESEIQGSGGTTTTNFSQTIAADSAFIISGSEINSIGEDDATNDYWEESRISDDNYSNYTYSRYSSNPNNMASPSIDLGSSLGVDTIRVDWYYCGYGADNFRVEAKDSSPDSNTGWTTIVSGLSDNGIPCSWGNHPQDIDVSSNSTPYRYWRLYIVDAQHYRWNVFSELEAFSSGSPGDIVEQHGADATDSPGSLYFSSSDLEMSLDGVRGHQSIGMVFDDIDTDQAATITSAYIEFTPDTTESSDVTLSVKGVDVDNAPSWSGNYAVDNAVDADSSDGLVGTSASTNWTPNNWTTGSNGIDTQVDVTSIVQELVDRTGWVADNGMAFAIQYVSGTGVRVAERSPEPILVINWSVTTTNPSPGGYVDADLDGDVDNPTLLKITARINYETQGNKQEVEFATFIRKYGVSD